MSDRVALADDAVVTDITQRMGAQANASPPILSFAASESSITSGDSVTLSWATTGADHCVAGGGWQGDVDLDGAAGTGALTETTSFELQCVGLGGTTSQSVQVAVTTPGIPPTTTLSASSLILEAGDSTTLTWSSQNADRCDASGDWSGAKSVAGSESTRSLDAS